MFGAEFEPIDVVVARDGAMAADQVGLMAALGFDRFTVIGHDRGARVTHRMALDHPDRVERLALVTGGPVPGAGHFLAEENHADTLAALQAFLRT